MTSRVVGFIFARGGSKGVPRKNLRLLAGKPLIAHAIETVRASSLVERIVVSTDDAEIAAVANQFGAEVPFMRPPELARDNSPEWLAWQHAIRALQSEGDPFDIFLSVPTTSPLRSVEDIDACIYQLLRSDADVVITVRPAERNPYFNMVVLDAGGYARLVISPSEENVANRQAAPAVFDMTTVAYAARPAFVLKHSSVFEGRVRTIVVPQQRALDIDTEFDLEIAEFLMARRNKREET
jgi:N,N'-diacetyl-8-epilegionaminate cytidylyltransferase